MRSMLRLLLVLFLGLLFSSQEAEAFGVRPVDIGYDLGGNRTYVGYGDAANNLSRFILSVR